MSDLDLEALRAIKFTSDQSDNGDLEKAVTLNHYALSKLFGYVLESDVPIVSMAVSGSDPTVIMKGKYKSALWGLVLVLSSRGSLFNCSRWLFNKYNIQNDRNSYRERQAIFWRKYLRGCQ